ncbi:hypothetical protein SNK04_014436 [Fusarium graminearum]
MNPSDAIASLVAGGMTEQAIAAELNVNQTTINRIRRQVVTLPMRPARPWLIWPAPSLARLAAGALRSDMTTSPTPGREGHHGARAGSGRGLPLHLGDFHPIAVAPQHEQPACNRHQLHDTARPLHL